MERYRNYGYRRSILTFAIIGITIFIFVYFPFFATNLRYTVGSLLRKVFDTIGSVCIVAGVLYLSVALFELYSRGHNWTKKVLVGVVLLYVGCWLTGIPFALSSKIGDGSSAGYH